MGPDPSSSEGPSIIGTLWVYWDPWFLETPIWFKATLRTAWILWTSLVEEILLREAGRYGRPRFLFKSHLSYQKYKDDTDICMYIYTRIYACISTYVYTYIHIHTKIHRNNFVLQKY